MRGPAEEKGLALDLAIDPAIPVVRHGDPGRVRQIIFNLVGNAVKFTDAGRVHVTVAPGSSDGSLRVAVEDTGPGISEEGRRRLFRPFSQVDSSSTRKHGGSGLGLAICRQLAMLMDGTLEHRNRNGGGSAFIAELVLPPSTAGAVESESALEIPDMRGARVLLAEDNRVNQKVATRMLERMNIEVDVASDGQQAIGLVTCLMDSLQNFVLLGTPDAGA